jgi:DNA-binding Lrp family transcriptional regulator
MGICKIFPVSSLPVDDTDHEMLRLLQRDASLPVAEIARRVGLSATPCWRRIQKLEEAQVITGRVALVDPEKSMSRRRSSSHFAPENTASRGSSVSAQSSRKCPRWSSCIE